MHKGKVQAAAIVSSQAAIVPLVNLDYTWVKRTWVTGQAAPLPSPAYIFRPQEKPSFSVLLPEWIEAGAAFLVTPSGTADIKWSAEGRLVTLTLDRLEDVAMGGYWQQRPSEKAGWPAQAVGFEDQAVRWYNSVLRTRRGSTSPVECARLESA